MEYLSIFMEYGVCWITERGGESVIENLILFNHKMQVLYQCSIIIQ
jgi:hypothetical protein